MTQEQRNYCNVHAWLRHNYGAASECKGASCNRSSKIFEWALIKGEKYEKNIGNFIQLCRSCHRKYDMTDGIRLKMSAAAKKRTHIVTNKPKANRKRVLSLETRLKRSERMKGHVPNFVLSGKGFRAYGAANPLSRKVLDTGPGIIYQTVKDAANYCNLKQTTLIMMLNGSNKNRTNLRYYDFKEVKEHIQNLK